MTPVRKSFRQTLTIARRDFTATVMTPVFLLFLLAPLIMGSISILAGMGATRVVDEGGGARASMVAMVPVDRARAVAAADTRLRAVFRAGEAPPALATVAPAGDEAATARAVFERHDMAAVAVLYGPLEHPTVLVGPRGARAADYLVALARETLADERLGDRRPDIVARRLAFAGAGGRGAPRHTSGFFAVFGIFFLTLFLAGQVVGTMAEERNNKVIEILAAAVPLESVFLGKLLGMFGVAVVFVVFWTTVIGQIGALMPAGMREGLGGLAPPIGGPAFGFLFIGYFAMAYLLLGAVFLGVGAQATTPREIQMLSLPITIVQVAMFAFASAAAAHPGSTVALAAELFPLSSPFAMVGRAASQPGLGRHAAALAWQALWVAIFVAAGARLFRRGVLQSGSARLWRRARAA